MLAIESFMDKKYSVCYHNTNIQQSKSKSSNMSVFLKKWRPHWKPQAKQITSWLFIPTVTTGFVSTSVNHSLNIYNQIPTMMYKVLYVQLEILKKDTSQKKFSLLRYMCKQAIYNLKWYLSFLRYKMMIIIPHSIIMRIE